MAFWLVCENHCGYRPKKKRGSADLKMNGNRAIKRQRPGVVGTAYTTVSVVNAGVFSVWRINVGALYSVYCDPYLPFRGPSCQIPSNPFAVTPDSLVNSKLTGVAFSRLPTEL